MAQYVWAAVVAVAVASCVGGERSRFVADDVITPLLDASPDSQSADDGQTDAAETDAADDDATDGGDADANADVDSDGGDDVEVETCDCLAVGDWYRFDQLAITAIDGEDHPAIPALNAIWANDIAAKELSVLLAVTAVSDTEIAVMAVDGARVDGTDGQVCAIMDTAGELTFPRARCALSASTSLSFNVYSGAESYPKTCSTTLPVKHVIPLSKTVLAATVSASCDGMNGTVPSGSLSEHALNQICTCLLAGQKAESCGELDPTYNVGGECGGCNAKYSSLGNLLTTFGEVQWNCTDDAGGRAACVEATWHAARLDASPPACTHSPP